MASKHPDTVNGMDRRISRGAVLWTTSGRWALRRLQSVGCLALLAVYPVHAPAQPPGAPGSSAAGRAAPSDRTALGIIFDEQHADESALDVHRRAMTMSGQERFAYLSRWVLPHEVHGRFRLQAGFTPTHPAPPAAAADGTQGTQTQGGEIVAPALDLIATAATLNKLDDLRRQVDALPVRPQDPIGKPALLALIDMARGDFEAARTQLEALLALAPADVSTLGSAREGLLLCVHQAANRPETSKVVVDAAYQIVTGYQDVYDRQPWHRQFSAAYARCRQAATQEGASSAPAPATSSPQWLAASRPMARRRGAGCPPAQWKVERGGVENLVSHDDDYLYFPIPLRGDYEVECDVTGFNWRESHLLVAGKWVAPVYNHESYDVGKVRGVEGRFPFAPRLTKTVETIHYRTAVRSSVATTWFNGRKIHEEPLPAEHEPWLAIRSAARQDGGVRDLRITGNPQIPETLRLSETPNLEGWVPYYEESIGGALQDWRHELTPEGIGEIRGRRRLELSTGCHQESLLVYHRPMFEDGVIEYEFWYEPGRFAAHAALDRLCLLLGPEGVRVHWLTDGKFDRTGLPPDNVVDEPENRRGSGELPLHAGQWNRVRLATTGDTVSLSLNRELVYQRRLEPTNQRTFGLFYYADRSELRVRNVVWRGDWPRALPVLDAQLLAVNDSGALDADLPKLTATFVHDFAVDGLPMERFSVINGDLTHHVAVQADGVHVRRPAVEGYRNITLAPSLVVSGDFDITAEYDQFAADSPDGGDSSIMLLLIADSPTADEGLLYRRRSLAGGLDRSLVQCARVRVVKGQPRRQYFSLRPVEALSGALRLARRGDRLYYLFAENDSRQFRLLGEESFPKDDLAMHGVRLVGQIHGQSGSTSVLWKTLAIRAERLNGLAAQDHTQLLADLNRARSALASSFTHDFTRQPPDDALFHRWNEQRPWRREDQGLVIVAPGTDHWSSTGAALRKQLEGDFDISLRFTPQRLDTPAQGQGSSLYLQVELADAAATQVSTILNKTSDGATEVVTQIRVPDGKGGHQYTRIGRISIGTAHELRLARRRGRIWGLVASEDFAGYRVVAQTEIGGEPVILGGTRVLVHTGGAGRESRVLWQSLQVKADRITGAVAPATVMPSPRPPALPPPKPPRKSFLQSIFDYFAR